MDHRTQAIGDHGAQEIGIVARIGDDVANTLQTGQQHLGLRTIALLPWCRMDAALTPSRVGGTQIILSPYGGIPRPINCGINARSRIGGRAIGWVDPVLDAKADPVRDPAVHSRQGIDTRRAGPNLPLADRANR